MGMSAEKLLGADPASLDYRLRQQEIAGYSAPFGTSQEKLAGLTGGLLGRGVANLFNDRGFFETGDPALRSVSAVNRIVSESLSGIDPTDSASMATAYGEAAKRLAEAGYSQPAALAAAEAAKMTKAEREAAAALAKAKGTGMPKASDIGSAIGQVRSTLGPIKQKLTDIDVARGYASSAKSGNAKASAQLDRYLAKASGDSQLSQTEVITVANAGGFGERVVNAINKFFSGTPSEMSIEEKEDVLNVLEIAYNQRYNQERGAFGTSYAGVLPDYIIEANAPPVALSPAAQRYAAERAKQAAAAAAPKSLSLNASKYLVKPASPAVAPGTVPQATVFPVAPSSVQAMEIPGMNVAP